MSKKPFRNILEEVILCVFSCFRAADKFIYIIQKQNILHIVYLIYVTLW